VKQIFKVIIRTSAFLGKEINGILRQTRLIMTLVLGPFLILLLFGIGYRNVMLPLRTLFVIKDDNPYREQVESYANSLGSNLVYQGMISDSSQALMKLKQGQVDLVVVVPDDAYTTIRNSQQATFELYHNEIDPYQAGNIAYFGNNYVDELNRQVLRSVAAEGQKEASGVEQSVAQARKSTVVMREALENGEIIKARDEKEHLNNRLDAISILAGGSVSLLQRVGDYMGEEDGSGESNARGEAIASSLETIHQKRAEIGELDASQESFGEEIESLRQMEHELVNLETLLADFQGVSPDVLVAPFNSQVQSLQGASLSPTDFFAPAVVILLLQHLAVTFSALSIVRERRSGTMELFRISPLAPMEILIGKYWSYLLYGTVMAAAITVTVVYLLKVPMSGAWSNYAIVLLTLLFTSLGLGFLISLISETDTQAVQYTMFTLLGSVFFSGFFLDLRYLWQPVQIVSWMLPSTYGIRMLQDIMLRGVSANPILMLGLLGLGILFFLVTWLLLRRQMRQE
jgi:ABC-2 type transport system permease protein